MPPINGTKHRNVNLLTKKSIKSAESVVSWPHRGIKNSTKSGQSKPRKKKNALRPYPRRRFMGTVIFCRFAMCQKFPFFLCVRKHNVIKQNVQIEIPKESPRKTLTFCWGPLRLWYPFLFVTSYSKTLCGRILRSSQDFQTFLLSKNRKI